METKKLHDVDWATRYSDKCCLLLISTEEGKFQRRNANLDVILTAQSARLVANMNNANHCGAAQDAKNFSLHSEMKEERLTVLDILR